MEQYTLKLTSGTSYRLYQGSTLVTDSDLTTLFSTAGSAYFNFDFNGGTPSATNTAVIVDSNGVTIVTITATILDSANYKGVWGDSATTFTSFDSLSGKSLDESQLSFLMGEIKESPVVGTDISTVIDTAFVSTANIQSDAVTTPKIADYNVTAEKLASESVTTAKIEDGAVTSNKIDCVSFINARFSGSWSTTSTSWADIPISTVVFSKGDKLTIENNGIRIGQGVQYIEVSGYALYSGGVTAGDIINIGISRLRNGSSDMMVHTYLRAGGNWESITIPTTAFSVQEGDVITMPFKNESRSGTQLDTSNTRLYVRTVS